MKKKDRKYVRNLIIRYLILVLIALPGLTIFYKIFSPLTKFPVAFLLDIFYDVSIVGNTIYTNCVPLEIIGACVAGSAYYLLLILNLSVPNLKTSKRIKSILFSFGILLAINILRIFVLGVMYMNGSDIFPLVHKVLWYLGSTLFVVGIWFWEVKKFKIKQIPFYTDFKILTKSIKK